jgi:hypothetical protein
MIMSLNTWRSETPFVLQTAVYQVIKNLVDLDHTSP